MTNSLFFVILLSKIGMIEMNKIFVASLENHDVYLFSDESVSFYLNIMKERVRTNITLDINYKKKNSINDIINYYEKIDDYNISLVVPTMKFEEDEKIFKKQSNLVSKVINKAHKLLTDSNIFVKDNINIIKHKTTRSDFVDFFINNFANRVRYLTLDNLVQEEVPYNKIKAANISFVVGKPELELTIKEDDMQEIIDNTIEKQKEFNALNKKRQNVFASGFISYYLLGFLTAIITLLILTSFIK